MGARINMVHHRLTLGLSVGSDGTVQTKTVDLFLNEYSPMDYLNIGPLGERIVLYGWHM